MDKAKRKELVAKYKEMKPDMGVYIVYSKVDSKYYIQATDDLKGTLNSTKFKLKFGGNHPCRELQKAWEKYGEENFEIEILEKLPYDKDETKQDYSDDLALLQMIWEEKLAKKGMELYKK